MLRIRKAIITFCLVLISIALAISCACIYTWDISVVINEYISIIVLAVMFFLSVVMLYSFYLYQTGDEDKSIKKVLIVFVTFIITIIACMLFMRKVSAFTAPLSILPIILTIMIGTHVGFMGLVVSIAVLLMSFGVMDFAVLGGISNGFYEITISLIVALLRVLLIIFLIRKNYSRFKLMWGALGINIVASLPITLLAMVVSMDWRYILSAYCYSVLGGLVAIIIFTALIPLYEQVFDVWTNFKLAEICSLSRPLLKRLSKEAPGTFNHCIIVSNLAEACAIEIGENPYLAKACGIYHDIGKIEAPEFFTENQRSYNPHDDLIPEHSAKMIISHTKVGYDMLKKAHLPEEIAKVAIEHHGTTTVKYFYNKAKQLTEGTVDDKLFMYEGPKPTSKIAAIVMIADVAEAISRSRKTESESELRKIIDDIIKEKIDEKQFDNSEITFSDLNKIATTISKVIPAVYHKRIDYRKKKWDTTMLNLYDFNKEEEKIAKKIFKTVCQIHGIKKRDISVDISMISKEQIKELNEKTRNVDRVTDVLSYPSFDNIVFPFVKNNYKEQLSPEDGTLFVGEILICRDVMKEQAEDFGHSEERECAFLITHGLLHLLGYDHIEDNMRIVMRAKEEQVLLKAKYLRF